MNLPSAKTVTPTRAASARPPRRYGRALVQLLVAVLPVIAGGTVWSISAGRHSAQTNLQTYTVGYNKLDRAIVIRGELKSAQSSDIFCHIKCLQRNGNYSTTIKWVIDDGARVKRGQVLVELDDAALTEDLQTCRVLLDQAQADWIHAEENYKILDTQNRGDLRAAEVVLQLAEIDLQKYLQGDYQQLRKAIQGRLALAESDLELWRDRVAFTERMAKKGYVQANQARSEQMRLHSARFSLDKVHEELRVLQEHSHVRTATELESKLKEAQLALERIKKQAKAKEIQADIERLTKQEIYQRRLMHHHEIADQIKKCTITAPQDGLVVYHKPERGRRSQPLPIVAQGEPVREEQLLMRLPNLTKMQVVVRIHEALTARVRGDVWQPTSFGDVLQATLLVAPEPTSRLLNQFAFAALREQFRDRDRRLVTNGQPALIRVDALPDRVLRGHVTQVATLAKQQEWSDVIAYLTLVNIDEPVAGLKPDMSAEVSILEDEDQDPVLTVPVQALFGSPSMGKQRKCFVRTPQGPEERAIVVGEYNARLVEVVSGLAEGEEVIVNPRALLNEKEKTAIEDRR